MWFFVLEIYTVFAQKGVKPKTHKASSPKAGIKPKTLLSPRQKKILAFSLVALACSIRNSFFLPSVCQHQRKSNVEITIILQ